MDDTRLARRPAGGGEIVGVWRRSAADISLEAWRRLSTAEREAVEAEAILLPLAGLKGPITVNRGSGFQPA